MPREPHPIYMTKLLALIASRTTCMKQGVGCIILNDKRHILATGVNGVARNKAHCTVTPCKNRASCLAIHAEQNAILQCKELFEIDSVYCSFSPCLPCAKLLISTSCKKFYYVYEAKEKHSAGLELIKSFMEVEQLPEI